MTGPSDAGPTRPGGRSDAWPTRPGARPASPDARSNDPDTRPNGPDSGPGLPDTRLNDPDTRPNGPDARPTRPRAEPAAPLGVRTAVLPGARTAAPSAGLPVDLPPTVPHRITGTDVHVTEPLPLPLPGSSGGDGGPPEVGRATTQAVQFLRECLSHGLRVTYDVPRPALGPEPGSVPDTYDLRALRHLPPPAEHPEERAELTDWRAGHAYGMLYHRRGPGFVTVMDRRERPASVRFTLDHPDLLAAFDALHEATPLDALTPEQREAAELLADERLALIADGWAVALPPRLRRWPVPCTGI